jgi:hypothetical protein
VDCQAGDIHWQQMVESLWCSLQQVYTTGCCAQQCQAGADTSAGSVVTSVFLAHMYEMYQGFTPAGRCTVRTLKPLATCNYQPLAQLHYQQAFTIPPERHCLAGPAGPAAAAETSFDEYCGHISCTCWHQTCDVHCLHGTATGRCLTGCPPDEDIHQWLQLTLCWHADSQQCWSQPPCQPHSSWLRIPLTTHRQHCSAHQMSTDICIDAVHGGWVPVTLPMHPHVKTHAKAGCVSCTLLPTCTTCNRHLGHARPHGTLGMHNHGTLPPACTYRCGCQLS